MLKELKEDVERVEKIMYKQNENINKEIVNLKNQNPNPNQTKQKRNSGPENHGN